jgi:hypothetical protein
MNVVPSGTECLVETQCFAQAVRLDALGRKNDADFWMHSMRNASCRAVLYSTKRLIPDGMIIFKSLNFEIFKLNENCQLSMKKL